MGAVGTLQLVEAGMAVIAGGGMLTGKGPAGGLKPRIPAPPKPPLLESQAQLTQGQQMEAAKAAALREGRASTILTDNANTGDRLGP